MNRVSLRLSAFAAALSLVAVGLLSSVASARVSPGQEAPDFALPDAKGTTHTLSQYKGKIVVLEWTNPTCPFVKRHYVAGTMKKLANQYADQGVVWLAIDSSHFVTPEDTQKWISSQELKYPVLLDPSGKVGQAYGAKTTPHMYIVDKDGKIAYVGAIDDDPRGEKQNPKNYVAETLAKLVKGEKPEVSETQPYGCSVKYNRK